jgi:hypothetical protein
LTSILGHRGLAPAAESASAALKLEPSNVKVKLEIPIRAFFIRDTRDDFMDI